MLAKSFNKIIQIGLVVNDREKVITSMREIFGVEPEITVKTIADDNRRYRGEPGEFQAEVLIYRFANIDIEFVVPISGPSIWQDWLDEHGSGLHHILFDVDSWDKAESDMAQKGIKLMQQGKSTSGIPGAKYGYFDSFDKLSFIVEMRNGLEKYD